MSSFCAAHRLPRAGIDPIDSEFTALLMIWHMMAWPIRATGRTGAPEEWPARRGVRCTPLI